VFGFFLSFGSSDGIEALWSFEEYLSRLFGLMIATGLLLQMPLFLFASLLLGFVSPESVARCRPYIVLLIFFLAAVLTPPDVASQVMLGVPLYLLFEGALLLGRVAVRSRAGGCAPRPRSGP
jgi:sec-independent protein translocase protein TatC